MALIQTIQFDGLIEYNLPSQPNIPKAKHSKEMSSSSALKSLST